MVENGKERDAETHVSRGPKEYLVDLRGLDRVACGARASSNAHLLQKTSFSHYPFRSPPNSRGRCVRSKVSCSESLISMSVCAGIIGWRDVGQSSTVTSYCQGSIMQVHWRNSDRSPPDWFPAVPCSRMPDSNKGAKNITAIDSICVVRPRPTSSKNERNTRKRDQSSL